MINNKKFSFLNKYIGSKQFYAMVLTVVLPIIIQNGITNFVGLLDNVMVGRTDMDQMSGVAIVNQLIFVFNLCIFGGIAGSGIYTAQFFGKGDNDGIRYTVRYKLYTAIAVSAIAITLFILFDRELISLFLHEGSVSGNIDLTRNYAQDYLGVMIFGLLPFALSQVYAGSLRETGETVLPMIAGVIAIIVNLCLNYVLIFGKFGAPAMGATGAAVATVISRFVELIFVMTSAHLNKTKFPYFKGLYKSFKIPSSLAIKITGKMIPLFFNEVLWAGGVTVMTGFYSTRGLATVAAINISNTIYNLFSVIFIAMGNAVAIIVGRLLGAGDMEGAKDSDRKLIFFSVSSCFAVGIVMASLSRFFPLLYNVEDEVRSLASTLIVITSILMPCYAYVHCAYFTLRSGGKTLITFLFDSAFMWGVSVPLAFVLSKFTPINIVPLFFTCQSVEFIKCLIGNYMINKGFWLNNIVK